MEMWHGKQLFDSPEHRRKELCRFVNFYNTVKPHRSLNGDTPFEVLQASFSTCGVNNATFSYILVEEVLPQMTGLRKQPKWRITFYFCYIKIVVSPLILH